MSAFTRIADLNQTSRQVSFVLPETDSCSTPPKGRRPFKTSTNIHGFIGLGGIISATQVAMDTIALMLGQKFKQRSLEGA
jgi:hypothetical protein